MSAQPKRITLDPDEIAYLCERIKEPYAYYKLLAGASQASKASKRSLAFLERLRAKLES